MNEALYNNDGTLNREEAWRRLIWWANRGDWKRGGFGLERVTLLANMLRKDENEQQPTQAVGHS